MIRYLWDENASYDILRALRRSRPDIDAVSVQQAGYAGMSDEEVLDLAVAEDRVIVTGDRKTLLGTARLRIREGAALPGVIVIGPSALSPGAAAADLALIADAAQPNELTNGFVFLPL